MDIVTAYLIGVFCFFLGWLARAVFAIVKCNRRQQKKDDAEQSRYLRHGNRPTKTTGRT